MFPLSPTISALRSTVYTHNPGVAHPQKARDLPRPLTSRSLHSSTGTFIHWGQEDRELELEIGIGFLRAQSYFVNLIPDDRYEALLAVSKALSVGHFLKIGDGMVVRGPEWWVRKSEPDWSLHLMKPVLKKSERAISHC